MQYLYAFLAMLLFGSSVTHAQILNFEKYRKAGDPALHNKVLGKIDLDLSLNNRSMNSAGEPDLYIGTSIATDLAYFLKKHAFYSFGNLVYSSVGEQEITRAGFVHLRSNFLRNRKLSYETFAQAQFDGARGLEQRLLAGSGIRLKIADSQKSRIAFGTGVMLEREHWKHGDPSVSITKKLVKSTSYLSLTHSVNERVNFTTIGYFQSGYDPGISKFRNRISGEFTFKANIVSTLSFTSSLFLFYESRPIVDIPKTVFSLTNGFSWSF